MAQTLTTTEGSNDQTRELTLNEIEAVAGAAKGDSGGLTAAKSIDLTAFLKELDKAMALIRAM